MRVIPIILLTLLSFAACNKKEVLQSPNYEVVLKKDGVKETFVLQHSSIQPSATIQGKTNFMFVAVSNDQKHHFAITIQVNGSFKTGIYQSGNSDYTVITDYFKNVGQTNEKDYTIDHAPSMPNSSFTVNITTIDEQQIKGTFSGNYLYDRLNNELIVVSEGNFTVKR